MSSARTLVRFDHHSPEYAQSYASIIGELQRESPVAWTEAHGGYWIATRYADVKFIGENADLFSSENRILQGDDSRRGVMIPQLPDPLMLNESDPPLHTKRRMVIAPFFTPKHLPRWVEAAVQYSREAIDAVIETGKVEFILDICLKVPAMTTLHVAGVDPYEWQKYALPGHLRSIYPADHPDYPVDSFAEIVAGLSEVIEERRREPRLDIASALATASIDGKAMSSDVAAGMLLTIVTGGFDTATAMFAHSLKWLAENPERRAWLREHPEAHENTVDELLRHFTPLHSLARNATRDIELGGQTIKAGERVLMSLWGANHDPAKFADPFEVRFDRENARDHVSYSSGCHRCVGSSLARIELRHLLGEILNRLPDFRIDSCERQDTIGVIDGWKYMNASFTPGRKIG